MTRLTSFTHINKTILSSLSKQETQEYAKSLESEKEPLALGLLCFAPLSDPSKLYDDVQQLAEKWSFEAAKKSKDTLTQRAKDQLIRGVAQDLRLTAKAAFELVNAYFEQNQNAYIYIQQLDEKANEQNVNDQMRYDAIIKALEAAYSKVLKGAKSFYLEERRTLLVLLASITAQWGEQGCSKVSKTFTDQNLAPKLGPKLIEGLMRNMTDAERQLKILNSQEELDLVLMQEQVVQLKTLFQLWWRKTPSVQELKEFMKYLVKTNFKGDFAQNQFYQSRQLRDLQETLKCFGTLCALAGMGLHNDQPAQLSPADVDVQGITAASAIVLLPILKEHSDSAEKLKKLPLLNEIQELLSSALVTKAEFTHIQPCFIELMHKWLDIFYHFASTSQPVNQEKIQSIQECGKTILKNKLMIEKTWKNGLESIKMFKTVFENPLVKFPELLPLLDVLCGQDKFPYAGQVFDYLKSSQLVGELYAYCSLKVIRLNSQQIANDVELDQFTNAVVVLCKIVKQNPSLFNEINTTFDQVAQLNRRKNINFQSLNVVSEFRQSLGDRSMGPSTKVELEGGDYPILTLLSRILQAYIFVDLKFSQRCLTHVIDAMRRIYSIYPLPVMQELKSTQTHYHGSPTIIQFITKVTQDRQSPRLTCSFLRFLKSIFKQPYPQACLQERDRAQFDQNFLTKALIEVYQPLLCSYSVSDEARCDQKLTYRLLALTRTLLAKFEQVPNNGQKVLLKMPQPILDMMLEVITTVINNDQVQNLCLNALQLTELQSLYYENALIARQIARGENIHMVNKVIIVAFQVLNKLLSLSLQAGQSDQWDKRSRQTEYVKKLVPVQSLSQQVQNQANKQTVQGRLLDLPALAAYYISPSTYLNNGFVKKEALIFVSQCMRIIKYELLQNFRSIYGHRIQDMLVTKFSDQLAEKELNPSQVDFWLTAVTHKQYRLLGELWKPEMSAKICKYLSECRNSESQTESKQKLCMLVSAMSQANVCLDLLQHNSYELLMELFVSVITPILKCDMTQPDMRGQHLFQFKGKNELALISRFSQNLNAKLTLCYFLHLLKIEFRREPKSNHLRTIIKNLYGDQSYLQMSCQYASLQTDLLQIVKQVNETDLKDAQYRDLAQQSTMLQYLHNTSPQQYEHPLQTHSGEIQFSETDGASVQESFSLLSHNPYLVFNDANFEEPDQQGLLGSHFCYDIKELEYTMRQECFKDPELIRQICGVFKEYNIVLSQLFVDQMLLKAKCEFFISVGQTHMKEQQSNTDEGSLITVSMVPFVEVEDVNYQNAERMQTVKAALIARAECTVRNIQQSLEVFKNCLDTNIVYKRTHQRLTEYFIIQLGALGHFAKTANQENSQLQNLVTTILHSLPDLSADFSVDGQTQYAQIVLLVFQILSSQKSRPDDQIALKTMGRVMNSMRAGHCFSEGLQIFNLACEVLKPEKLHQFLQKSDSQVLRMIIQKANDQRTTNQEVQHILTLMQSIATYPEGATHLQRIKLLEQLHTSDSLRQINDQEIYIVQGSSMVRNQTHTRWLQILLLIRQMNTHLLVAPRQEQMGYFKSLCNFVRQLQQRFTYVLNVCLSQQSERTSNQGFLIGQQQQALPPPSLAMFEEIEVVFSVLYQLFEHADLWAEVDYTTYANLKDYVFIQAPLLMSNFRAVQPISAVEHHLAQRTTSSKTALQTKVEMSLANIMLCAVTSLYNVFSLQKETTKVELVDTWQSEAKRLDDAPTLYSTLLRDLQEPVLQYAYENLLSGCQKVDEMLKEYRGAQSAEEQVKWVADLYMSNQWIQNEMQGGLNAAVIVESQSEMIDLMETTLGVSLSVLTSVLERITFQMDTANHYIPNRRGDMSYSATAYYDRSYVQGGYLAERVVVNMIGQLQKYIQDVSTSVKWDGSQVWGPEPKEYQQKLLEYSDRLANNLQQMSQNVSYY